VIKSRKLRGVKCAGHIKKTRNRYKLVTGNFTDTGKEGERHHFKDQGELWMGRWN
jgi:hypothetical protein